METNEEGNLPAACLRVVCRLASCRPLSRILPPKVATDQLRTITNLLVERLIGTLGVNIWTGCSSGASGTWKRNWKPSNIITIGTVSIRDWLAKCMTKWPTPLPHDNQPTLGIAHGSRISMGFLIS